jgi:IS605 OrfB family transposase
VDRLISIGELAELKAVSVDTIRRWEKEGKLESVRTDGGHRRYRLSDFVEQKIGKTIAYARVSSHDQKADLDRQDAVLSGYCQSFGWEYEVIRDLGSGMNNKKRRLTLLVNRLEHLKIKPIKAFIPRGDIFVVGSKDESFGNQVCQWNGDRLTFRVPKCLEARFGKTVSSEVGDFERNINRLPECGAKTWHFYRKSGKWVIAVQFTPKPVKRTSKERLFGCIGIDMNPGSIGWVYVDPEGNLKAKGQISLQMGLPCGKQQAQIVDACLQLAAKATEFECPVVCEKLDFSTKKESLREKSRKYARMLSSWAYSEFYKQLNAILSNRGIELIAVNPAYSSTIGLVKYLRMYGLASDESAALVIARRAMKLSEKIPCFLTAYSEVNSEKQVGREWNQLNKKIGRSAKILRHCDYYSVSNWSFLVNLDAGEAQALRKNV